MLYLIARDFVPFLFLHKCLWLSKKFETYHTLTNGEGNGTPLQYSCLENPMDGGAWWAAVHGVAKSRTRLSDFPFTFHLHALEKEMATHSSVLAWRIPGTGEPGGLLSMGSHRVGHDWSDLAAVAAAAAAAYISFYLLMYIWLLSTLEVLMLLWRFGYKSFCRHMFSLFLGK